MKITDETPPKCEVCKEPMLRMYGSGWDYDRFICGSREHDFEIELDTTTYVS